MELLKKLTQKQNREEAIKRVKFIMEHEPITSEENKKQEIENNKLLSKIMVAGMSGHIPIAEVRFRGVSIKDIPEKRIKDEMYCCSECDNKDGILYHYKDDEGYGDYYLCSKCRQKMKNSL